MTKEEIEDSIWGNKKTDTLGKIEAQNAIDFMQEDFNSRTCENCKLYLEDRMRCMLLGITTINKDFGCNRFNPKESK